MWQRPVPLFQEDSLTIFAEQVQCFDAWISPTVSACCGCTIGKVRFKSSTIASSSPTGFGGRGQTQNGCRMLTIDAIDLLPGCVLSVEQQPSGRFVSSPLPDTRCCFSYAGETRQVSLGFEADPQTFLSYDKGIDNRRVKRCGGR